MEKTIQSRATLTEPVECIDVEQVAPDDRRRALREGNAPLSLLVYALLGLGFGIVLVKSQVVSWYRIQEMFLFDSFHMYGIIGSAVVVAAIGVWLIKRMEARTLHGEPIVLAPKAWSGAGTRYWAGGIVFGLGWALLGACPGPMFALVGGGVSVILVAVASALAGTWAYGVLRPRLPH